MAGLNATSTSYYTDKFSQAQVWLKNQFSALKDKQDDSSTKVAKALTECASGGLLLATRSLTKNYTGSIVASVLTIGSIVLFVDALRRVAPVAGGEKYAEFYKSTRIPGFVRTLMSKPVVNIPSSEKDSKITQEITKLKDVAAAKTFATKEFDITLHDKHEIKALKDLLQDAARAKTVYQDLQINYKAVMDEENQGNELLAATQREYYFDLLKAKISYAHALMVLKTEGKLHYPFSNEILKGYQPNVLKVKSLEKIDKISALKLGDKSWTVKQILAMTVHGSDDIVERDSDGDMLRSLYAKMSPNASPMNASKDSVKEASPSEATKVADKSTPDNKKKWTELIDALGKAAPTVEKTEKKKT